MTDIDITPPEFSNEQFDQWSQEAPIYQDMGIARSRIARSRWLCKAAIAWATPIVAQQAADAELEACCVLLAQNNRVHLADDLRAARRPEPKSKLQIAEELLDRHEDGWVPSPAQWNIIREGLAEGRRALKFRSQVVRARRRFALESNIRRSHEHD